MARTGPVARNTATVALGLAQIRIGESATNIATVTAVLAAANSIGCLANTKFNSNVDFWKLESGFPLLEDMTIPIREAASMECAFKEINPFNLSLARGIDPVGGSISETVSGEILLGNMSALEYIRMEALYTYPDATNTMTIIFPRGQVAGSVEMDLQAEDAVAVPVVIEAKRADSETSGGDAAWDSKPLGHILFVTP